MRSLAVLASLLLPLVPCRAQPAPAFVNGGVQAPGSGRPAHVAVDLDFFRGGVSVPGAIVSPGPAVGSVPTLVVRPGADVRAGAVSRPAAAVVPAPPSVAAAPVVVPSASHAGQLPPLPPDCVARGVDTILTPACMRYLTSEPPRLMRLGSGGGDPGVADLSAAPPAPPLAATPPLPPAPSPAVATPGLQCRVTGPRGREDPMTVLNPESCLRMASASMVTRGAYAVMMVGSDGNVVVVACDVPQDGDRPGCAVRP